MAVKRPDILLLYLYTILMSRSSARLAATPEMTISNATPLLTDWIYQTKTTLLNTFYETTIPAGLTDEFSTSKDSFTTTTTMHTGPNVSLAPPASIAESFTLVTALISSTETGGSTQLSFLQPNATLFKTVSTPIYSSLSSTARLTQKRTARDGTQNLSEGSVETSTIKTFADHDPSLIANDTLGVSSTVSEKFSLTATSLLKATTTTIKPTTITGLVTTSATMTTVLQPYKTTISSTELVITLTPTLESTTNINAANTATTLSPKPLTQKPAIYKTIKTPTLPTLTFVSKTSKLSNKPVTLATNPTQMSPTTLFTTSTTNQTFSMTNTSSLPGTSVIFSDATATQQPTLSQFELTETLTTTSPATATPFLFFNQTTSSQHKPSNKSSSASVSKPLTTVSLTTPKMPLKINETTANLSITSTEKTTAMKPSSLKSTITTLYSTFQIPKSTTKQTRMPIEQLATTIYRVKVESTLSATTLSQKPKSKVSTESLPIKTVKSTTLINKSSSKPYHSITETQNMSSISSKNSTQTSVRYSTASTTEPRTMVIKEHPTTIIALTPSTTATPKPEQALPASRPTLELDLVTKASTKQPLNLKIGNTFQSEMTETTIAIEPDFNVSVIGNTTNDIKSITHSTITIEPNFTESVTSDAATWETKLEVSSTRLPTTTTGTVIDCGVPELSPNSVLSKADGTSTVGSRVTYVCHSGFKLEGNSSLVCLNTGNWSGRPPNCSTVDCQKLKPPANGNVSCERTIFNATATYSCLTGYTLQGYPTRRCLSSGEWSGIQPLCVKGRPQVTPCTEDTDSIMKKKWDSAEPGQTVTKPCPQDYTGEISRECGVNGLWNKPLYSCIRLELDIIDKQTQNLKVNPTQIGVSKALDSLANLTTVSASSTTGGVLLSGELEKVTDVLSTIANLPTKITENQTDTFIETASNLLSDKNSESWKSVSQSGNNKGAQTVLRVIDNFADLLTETLISNKTAITVEKSNIVLYIGKVSPSNIQDIQFPKRGNAAKNKNSWIEKSQSGIMLNKTNIAGNVTSYSSAFYKNLSGILPSYSESGTRKGQQINSAVLAFTLNPTPTELQSPIRIIFEHFHAYLSFPMCSFWSFNSSENGSSWSSAGCKSVSSNKTITVCECDHLTNFAILMSPFVEQNVVTKAMDILSIVGCVISIICLLVTIVIHAYFWRYLKSDRVIILLNLCCALVISYIIFLAGVDKTESKAACQTIAVLLQYVYLVVFFLMLAEGIEITFMVVYVFAAKSRVKWLLTLAWGFPAVIVGISIGATQLNGYGNNDFCWLAVDSGLIWAFVGPALVILLINMVLLAVVFKSTFGAKSVKEKSRNERVKTGVRCLCVLLPLIGLTWVIGVFYVNENEAWIQYVFASCNSLQGFFIFLFHCLLNKQIRHALRQKRRRYLSTSMESKIKLSAMSSDSRNKEDFYAQQEKHYGKTSTKSNFSERDRKYSQTSATSFEVMRWDESSTEDIEFPQFHSNIIETPIRIKRPTLSLSTSHPDSGEFDGKVIPEYQLFKRPLGQRRQHEPYMFNPSDETFTNARGFSNINYEM